jgi:hypothetical protein
VLLRDGFAVAAAGGNEPFARLAEGALRVVLAGTSLNRPADEAAAHVLSGFARLGVHPDVPEGVRILRRQGLRLVTLTNGSADVADGLLTRAGLRGEFERLLSVEDAAAWKPAPAAYAHAARACSVSMERCIPGTSTARTRRACAPGGSPGSRRRTRTTLPPLTCKLKVLQRSRSRSFPELFHPVGCSVPGEPALICVVQLTARHQRGDQWSLGRAIWHAAGRIAAWPASSARMGPAAATVSTVEPISAPAARGGLARGHGGAGDRGDLSWRQAEGHDAGSSFGRYWRRTGRVTRPGPG